MNSRDTAQISGSVTTRAVLIALALTIPNSHWLMINWGAGDMAQARASLLSPRCISTLYSSSSCC